MKAATTSSCLQTSIEEWRPVGGYEGLYEVSSLAAVRRISGTASGQPRAIKQFPTNRGYRSVSLSRDGTAKSHKVHVLVAVAFKGPRPLGMVINHVDPDKSRNAADNLEYVTPKQNSAHAQRLGLLRPPTHRACKACRQSGHNRRTCPEWARLALLRVAR